MNCKKILAVWLSVCILLGAGCGLKKPPVDYVSSLPAKLSGESTAAERVFLSVPYISQEGLLPTGCEIISAMMVLRFYGYELSAQRFVEEYLDMEPLVRREGYITGPHPADAFVGDPRDAGGYGCYAPVIAASLRRIVSAPERVTDATGVSLDTLAQQYIDKGIPVLVWLTIDLRPSEEGTTWFDRRTGERFTWRRPEHCMVLVGYDASSYYFNDPYKGNGIVSHDRETVRQRFEEMGKQSVVLLP